MKTTSYPTDYILIKAQTNSDWDNCNFAIIHCPQAWKESIRQRLKSLQLVEDDDCFVSLNYRDTSVDFYVSDEDIDALLQGKEWAFVELEESGQERFAEPENRLNCYRLSLYQSGTAMFTAQGKHSGDEFWTAEFSLAQLLNDHQESIKIMRLF